MTTHLPPVSQPFTGSPDALTMPPGYIAALDHNGRLVAVPAAPEPAPESPEEVQTATQGSMGLPPVVGQVVVLGSISLLAASGAFWLAAAALRAAHPVLPDAIACLKWAVVFVALVVVGVFAAKARTRNASRTTLSVWHTTKTTSIGSQTVRGRGNRGITNNL